MEFYINSVVFISVLFNEIPGFFALDKKKSKTDKRMTNFPLIRQTHAATEKLNLLQRQVNRQKRTFNFIFVLFHPSHSLFLPRWKPCAWLWIEKSVEKVFIFSMRDFNDFQNKRSHKSFSGIDVRQCHGTWSKNNVVGLTGCMLSESKPKRWT